MPRRRKHPTRERDTRTDKRVVSGMTSADNRGVAAVAVGDKPGRERRLSVAEQKPKVVKRSLSLEALGRIGADTETLRSAEALHAKFARMNQTQRKQLASMRLLTKRVQAREHLPTFIDVVMREERTQAPVMCLPHQRVLFDFVWAHPLCVVRMPVGTSKTWCMSALTMFLMGRNPTVRGAIISATQQQAQKPLSLVADYLKQPKLATALRMVFPHLRPSSRVADKWTQTALTVERPPGIRDPSLVAVGVDGNLPGSRLSWIVVDDILSRENTSTKAGLQKVFDFFDSTVLSRLDRDGDARCVVTNTPWHPHDLTYRLEEAGWPTLTMDVMGGIHLSNCDDWDTDDIRPSTRVGEWYRLSEHDKPAYDHDESRPLWEQKYSLDTIEKLRTVDHAATPARFNQLYMSLCRDDESSRCKEEWLEQCKDRSSRLVAQYQGHNATVTGVDLGVGDNAEQHDRTVFFTCELLPNGKKRILDVEGGHWDGPTIVKKLIAKHAAYNSIVRVENVAAQDYILQFTRATNASVPVKPHMTGRNKAHPEFGVEAIFAQFQGKGWIIPAYADGRVHAQVQEFLNDCMYYEPGKHTGDYLMAAWFANEQARDLGFGALGAAPNNGQMPGGFAMNLLSR